MTHGTYAMQSMGPYGMSIDLNNMSSCQGFYFSIEMLFEILAIFVVDTLCLRFYTKTKVENCRFEKPKDQIHP